MMTIIKIAWLRLWNNKTELLLTFVVPILFFSIFAFIFTRGISGDRAAPKITVIDDDQSPFSGRLREALGESDDVVMHETVYSTKDEWTVGKISRHTLENHQVDAIVYLPASCGADIEARKTPEISIATEGSDPFTAQTTKAIVLQATASALRPKPVGKSLPREERSRFDHQHRRLR